MKKKLYSVLIVLFTLFLIIEISGNHHVFKAVYHNFARIDNPEIFANDTLKAVNPIGHNYAVNQVVIPDTLEEQLKELESLSFLVLKDDSIVLEKYWNNHSPNEVTNSFSMAKSIVSVLIGVAIKEGKIESVNDPVSKYLPSYLDDGREEITIKDVLQMSSGLSWFEDYINPFSDATKAYYGEDLLGMINARKVEKKSGKVHQYLSGDTQILSLLLTRAVKKKVSQYASEKLWEPLGMETDALWSLDHEGGEVKGYCCIHSTARDFAKIGQLWMHKGNWNGVQLVDSSFVEEAITPCLLEDFESQGQKVKHYGYQWWLHEHNGSPVFYMRGILGQFVICYPKKNVILVRLGHKRGERVGKTFQEVVNMLNFADSL